MEIVYIVVGIIIGSAAAYLITKSKIQASSGKLEERNSMLEESLRQAKSELDSERSKVLTLNSELSKSKTEHANLNEKLKEQKDELEKLQQKFIVEFENLANKILDEKSRKFTEQNKANLDDILKPLGEKIKDFEKRVNDIYVSDTRERASLAEQIKTLHELNQQMSREATNLTRALKGDTKTQGSWGEFILESILEKSGLEKDREYLVQTSIRNEDGSLLRPDVIVNLPENKSVVIDSKVSLTAYEAYCSAEEGDNAQGFLREHINSIRNHIKRLSPKEYQNLYGLQSLDFVLMFIPIEPALIVAVQTDANIFYEAFEKNIVIVSPSTLLATLRTIASIWRQEKQNRNAIEIAKQSGALYDKFVSFINDLEDVGDKINKSQESYEEAMKKLCTGRGNIVRQIENIKQLGAKATKSLPNSLIDKAEGDNKLSG
jgi:DNA recombination protein RmuC